MGNSNAHNYLSVHIKPFNANRGSYFICCGYANFLTPLKLLETSNKSNKLLLQNQNFSPSPADSFLKLFNFLFWRESGMHAMLFCQRMKSIQDDSTSAINVDHQRNIKKPSATYSTCNHKSVSYFWRSYFPTRNVEWKKLDSNICTSTSYSVFKKSLWIN